MAKPVVVATDGTDLGHRAVDFAARLSMHFDLPLRIVHVLLHGWPDADITRMVEVEGLALPAPASEEDVDLVSDRVITALGEHIAATAKTRAEEAGALEVTARICSGEVAHEILDVAEAERAEIIVVGRRGLGQMRETLFGSVSQKVLHHAHCTVAIVP